VELFLQGYIHSLFLFRTTFFLNFIFFFSSSFLFLSFYFLLLSYSCLFIFFFLGRQTTIPWMRKAKKVKYRRGGENGPHPPFLRV